MAQRAITVNTTAVAAVKSDDAVFGKAVTHQRHAAREINHHKV